MGAMLQRRRFAVYIQVTNSFVEQDEVLNTLKFHRKWKTLWNHYRDLPI